MQGRIPQLDGIRGLAILLVIFHNESKKYPSLNLEGLFANGWMGVDLFFVLSGFLITGILLDTKGSEGYLKNFYVRRCLRVWPLYYSLILFMFVVLPALRPGDAADIFARSSPWWSYPVFLQNLLVAGSTNAAGPLGVTWSLAIEEQFYLVWPWVVGYCSSVQLRRIAIAVICVSPLLRLVLSSAFSTEMYSNTFCRLDGLMAGAVLAVVIRSDNFEPLRFMQRAWGVLAVSLPLAFVMEEFGQRFLVFSLSALASVSLVYVALYSGAGWLRVVLTNRFMVYTGTISYGLYLLHKLPFDVAEVLSLDRQPLLAAPLLLVACYLVAALSWSLLEKPFLRLKKLFESKPTANAYGV